MWVSVRLITKHKYPGSIAGAPLCFFKYTDIGARLCTGFYLVEGYFWTAGHVFILNDPMREEIVSMEIRVTPPGYTVPEVVGREPVDWIVENGLKAQVVGFPITEEQTTHYADFVLLKINEPQDDHHLPPIRLQTSYCNDQSLAKTKIFLYGHMSLDTYFLQQHQPLQDRRKREEVWNRLARELPRGRIARSSGSIVATSISRLAYHASTAPGWSGSAVVSSEAVLGVHNGATLYNQESRLFSAEDQHLATPCWHPDVAKILRTYVPSLCI